MEDGAGSQPGPPRGLREAEGAPRGHQQKIIKAQKPCSPTQLPTLCLPPIYIY